MGQLRRAFRFLILLIFATTLTLGFGVATITFAASNEATSSLTLKVEEVAPKGALTVDPFPPPKTLIKDERTRLNALQALRIAIASISDIVNSRDQVVVTNIRDNILGALNQKEIDFNFEIIELYKAIATRVSQYGLDKAGQDAFQTAYDRKILEAFAATATDAGPTFGWLEYLAPAFSSTLSDYLDYGVNSLAYRGSLGPKVWRLTPKEALALTESLNSYLSRAWALLDFYAKPGDYRLTPENFNQFGQALNAKDKAAALAALVALEEELGFYPPYWFYRGYALLTLDRLEEAVTCFERFIAVWRPVLNKDGLLADAAKYALILAIRQGDLVSQKKYADLIAQSADKDGWLNLLLAGVVYDELGDQEKAEDCFQKNLDNGRGPLASYLALDYVHQGGQAAAGLLEYVGLKPYYEDGTREIAIVKERADAGDPLARYALGVLTQSGVATSQDLKKAAKWFGLAADQGFAKAQNALGELYRDGQGLTQDLAKAANLFFQAADQGDPRAEANLGLAYLKGAGVTKNPVEAAKWLNLAATVGEPRAQLALGEIYFQGQGAQKDQDAGLKWLLLAAENGSTEAQFQLAKAYAVGEGTPKDLDLSQKWLRAAALGGNLKAQEVLDSSLK
ncbi:MAG: sel1 repeat family protein [Deltaproteobacteria bacterium]|nr:sel1 repeat family protein [Deltaproteobacteria bacterium]